MEEFKLKFTPSIIKLNEVKDSVQDTLSAWNISKIDRMDILLAIDESITNIITHGYDSVSSDDYVDLSMEFKKNQIVIRITDTGREFDFVTAPVPDIRQNLAGLKKGGFGVHLIKSVMDSAVLTRENGKNTMVLTKILTG